MLPVPKIRCVVLISGRGTNLEAILAAASAIDYPAEIVAVIANKADAGGLKLAQRRGVPTEVVPSAGVTDREDYDKALQRAIDRYVPDLVVLAGFMRILTVPFVQHYAGRMMNIHPSLLPAFPGLHTHQRALDAGVRVHGCTVHFVTADLDHGPIIAQAAIAVAQGDSVVDLASKILVQEHRIYPEAIRWFATDRLSIAGQRVALSGEAVPDALLICPTGLESEYE